MVSTDDRLQGAEFRSLGQWGRPRLLLAVLAAIVFLSAFAVFINSGAERPDETGWSISQWLREEGLVSVVRGLGDGAAEDGAAGLDSKPWHQHRVCERILQIVESACGYQSADRDSEVYWACVTGELKYTMWSAYGCN